MPESSDAGLPGVATVAVGWLVGLAGYDLLTSWMLARGWLERSGSLTPGIYDAFVVGLGVAAAVAVGVSDWRGGRPSRQRLWMRGIVAAGAIHVGLGLYHAHAVAQFRVVGPDAVLAKDVLYHAPGIALLVVGWNLRPVSARARTSP